MVNSYFLTVHGVSNDYSSLGAHIPCKVDLYYYIHEICHHAIRQHLAAE